MKNKRDQGFSLIEILVAIVILTAIVVPTCSALVMTNEMNNRSDDLMKAQLAVSSAVETLMAEGISPGKLGSPTSSDWIDLKDEEDDEYEYSGAFAYADSRFPTVTISVAIVSREENVMPWYAVRVTSSDGLVEVETTVKEKSGGSQ